MNIRGMYKPIWTREFGWINPVGGGDGEEDAEKARLAKEQSVQPTTELEPPKVEGASGGKTEQPKTLLAGKYESPEALEKAYNDLLEKKNAVENENSQYRDYYAREQSESRAQVTESTSDTDEQKTVRQNAEALAAQGKYLDAAEMLSEAKTKTQLKPIVDRQEAQEKENRKQMAVQAFESLKTDKENFPGFSKLETKMDTIYQERVRANPAYDNSFKSAKAMMASLYFEARGLSSEVNSNARELAGAMSGGSGAGARTRGLPQAASSDAKPRWQTDDRWDKLDMPRNAYQFDESPEDISNRELAEQGERIRKLLEEQLSE